MKSNFVYPTIKNSMMIFICFQIVPIIISMFGKSSFSFWILMELIGVGIVILLPLKPITEMDERELALELKWKSRMFETMATCILIPIALLLFKPDSTGWAVLNSLSFPAFTFIVILSIFKRRDWGNFFANPTSLKNE